MSSDQGPATAWLMVSDQLEREDEGQVGVRRRGYQVGSWRPQGERKGDTRLAGIRQVSTARLAGPP